MRARLSRLAVLLCLVLSGTLPTLAQNRDGAAAPRKPVIGDFAAEIRRPDGHIDTEAMIAALKELRANTYFYLIWHKPTDWEDLPAFADAAAREGIDVWVYLVPWSETPPVKDIWGFPEPYRNDYVRWAEEIGKLSIRHRNIVGWVMDDFYGNTLYPDRFTVPYVRRMIDAGRKANPDLKFYALCYFPQPWEDFLQRFGDLVDGVVAAYPKSPLQVKNALWHLNGKPHGASVVVDHPRSKPSRVGDKGAIQGDFRCVDPDNAAISFYWDDTDVTTNRGYHQVFVKVDGRTVWQADTAGDTDDRVVNVNLSRYVRGGNVRIELGVFDQRAVSKYPVNVRLDDIRLTGFDTPEMVPERRWTRRATGNFTVMLAADRPDAAPAKLPMILMPTGEVEQYEKRYSDPGTPRSVAAKVRMSLDLVRDGRVQGVVTYCLPKQGPTFDAVAPEFRRAAADVGEPRSTARR